MVDGLTSPTIEIVDNPDPAQCLYSINFTTDPDKKVKAIVDTGYKFSY